MTLNTRKSGDPAPSPAPMLSFSLSRLPIAVRVVAALLSLGLIAAVAFAAVTFYPNTAPPPATEVERQASALFTYQTEGADTKLTGDLLVERFYALDAETGEHYVADMLKGKIQGIQSLGPENSGPYLALLDLRGIQRDRALYSFFVDWAAHPDGRYGNYLGLRTFSGASDAFRLNYDGFLPESRETIHGPNGEGPFEFLLTQKYEDITKDQKLVKHNGHNYLVTNTDRFPFFRSEFKTGKALLMSELIIVDTTGTNQRARLLQIQQQIATQTPRQP